MLNRRIALLLSMALLFHYGRGWVIEGEPEEWQYALSWILIYAINPVLSLIPCILYKGNKVMMLFSWSVFAVFFAELLEEMYWRIPDNTPSENSLISSVAVSIIILNGLYRVSKMSYGDDKTIAGIGIGYGLGKTLFSKLWWSKVLAALIKIFT